MTNTIKKITYMDDGAVLVSGYTIKDKVDIGAYKVCTLLERVDDGYKVVRAGTVIYDWQTDQAFEYKVDGTLSLIGIKEYDEDEATYLDPGDLVYISSEFFIETHIEGGIEVVEENNPNQYHQSGVYRYAEQAFTPVNIEATK